MLIALGDRPHATADELGAIVATVPRTSLQSVYNALGDFVEAGLVRRIEPAGRPVLFELRVGDNHHHLDLHRVRRRRGCRLRGRCRALPRRPPTRTASRSRVAEVTFWGRCATCAASAR